MHIYINSVWGRFRLSVSGILAALAVLLAVGWLLFPRLSTPKEHTDQNRRRAQLRTIVAAITEHFDDSGRLPTPTTSDEIRLSWRVAILPYLGEQELYNRINRNADWDHPDNVEFHDQMPHVFRDPTLDSQTTSAYIALVGPGTCWPTNGNQIGFDDIKDGCSNTACLITFDSNATNWMAPETYKIVDFFNEPENDNTESMTCAFMDGHVSKVKRPGYTHERGSVFYISDWPNHEQTDHHRGITK